MGTPGLCIAMGNPFCGPVDRGGVLPLRGLGGGEGGVGWALGLLLMTGTAILQPPWRGSGLHK